MKETYLGERNRNIVVYLLVIQVSICINPITAIFKNQYAFNAEDAPTKEEEILAGRQTQRADDAYSKGFADRTPNLLADHASLSVSQKLS